MADLEDELRELKEEPSAHELGDVLFAAVNVSRKLDVDPELALRARGAAFPPAGGGCGGARGGGG